MRSTVHAAVSRLERLLSRPAVFWFIPILGSFLVAPSIFSGYAGDDYFHRMVLQDFPGMPEIAAHPGISSVPWDTFTFAPGDEEGNRLYVERGLLPWWSPEDVLFRRLHFPTSVTHWLDMVLFGHRAWAEHVHNVLLYFAVVVSAGLVYRRLLTPLWVAALAALLYAIDDAHGMTVAWIMNRNALHGAIFGYLALAAHIRWRQEEWRWGLPLAWISLALGVACSEGTLAIGAYLFAHMLFLDERGSLPVRFARLLPYAGLVVIWRVVYDWLGFGIHGSGIYVDLGSDMDLFLEKLAFNLPTLLLSLFAAPNPAWGIILTPAQSVVYSVIAALIVCALFLACLPVLRASRTARFFALGAVLSTMPFCATLPDQRLLLFSGLGAMGLVAEVVRYAGQHFDTSRHRGSRAVAFAAGFLLLFNLVKSPLTLPLESLRFAYSFRMVSQSVDSLPSDPGVEDQTLVIVRAPSDWFLLHIPQIRSAEHQHVPRHIYTLCSVPDAVTVARVDAYTLEIAPENGFLVSPWATMFCRGDQPFERDEVALKNVTITILERDPLGLPTRARFRFEESLDSPGMRLVTYTRGGFEDYDPPPQSETVRMERLERRDMVAKAPTEEES